MVAHPLLDDLAALLQVAIGHGVHVIAHTQPGFDTVEIDLHLVGVDAQLTAELLAVALGKQHRDIGDFTEQI